MTEFPLTQYKFSPLEKSIEIPLTQYENSPLEKSNEIFIDTI